MQGVKFGETSLYLKIFEFRNTDWVCQKVVEDNMDELSLWRFEATDGSSQGRRSPIPHIQGVPEIVRLSNPL
jgi:hypothetical protein